MNKLEMNNRISLYIARHCKDTNPRCEICWGEAELYDTNKSKNYCYDCLKDELLENQDFLIENTREQ